MASADSSRLSAPSLTRLPLSGRAVRPPQVNMASFAPLAAAYIFRTSCRHRTSLLFASSSVLSDLECGFCTSVRGFVSGFLQIPPHEGHPCLRLAVPSARPAGDLHPQESKQVCLDESAPNRGGFNHVCWAHKAGSRPLNPGTRVFSSVFRGFTLSRRGSGRPPFT